MLNKPKPTLLILLILLIFVLPFVSAFGPFRFQTAPPTDPMLVLIGLLYAFGVSWVAERFGAFDKLSPTVKQLVIALAGFAVPLVAGLVTGIFGKWPDTLGTPEGLTQAIFIFVAPVAVWLLTQVAHYADQILKRAAGKANEVSLPFVREKSK